MITIHSQRLYISPRMPRCEPHTSIADGEHTHIAGADEALGKKADMLAAYGDGPFYLVKFVPSYVATMGGVKTDASCQALGENGSVIPGLFAVGEATHRFMYNRSFVRHCSNSSALTMGRLTGAALATA